MDQAAFAERASTPDDVPFIADSFCRSYAVAGHTAGIRDRFRELIGRPFVALLSAVGDAPDSLLSARVVYPVAEPSEIAGYAVWSPRHSALLYVLTKPAYSQRRVAAHLLSRMPTVQSGDPKDARPHLLHTFSTAAFSKMTKRMELRTRYSPFLFLRMLDELTDPGGT